MKQFVLLFFGLISSVAFSNVTTPVCPEPSINSSEYHENLVVFFATILGSRSSVCGLYSDDYKLDFSPSSIPVPDGARKSRISRSCTEIQCRARNAAEIITNAKTVIELSHQAVNGEIKITRENRRKITAGISRIEKTVPDWEKILLKPYTEYTYRDAEEYIAKSLEILTLKQVELLPIEIIESYLLELRRIEEAERQRVEEERRRAEAERQRVEEERRRKTIESGIEPDRYYVTAEVLNVRDAPKTGTVVDTLSGGEFVRVVHQEAGWGQLESTGAGSRWVSMDYLARVKPSASDGAWGGGYTIALTILMAMTFWAIFVGGKVRRTLRRRLKTDKEYQDAKKSGQKDVAKARKAALKTEVKADIKDAQEVGLSTEDWIYISEKILTADKKYQDAKKSGQKDVAKARKAALKTELKAVIKDAQDLGLSTEGWKKILTADKKYRDAIDSGDADAVKARRGTLKKQKKAKMAEARRVAMLREEGKRCRDSRKPFCAWCGFPGSEMKMVGGKLGFSSWEHTNKNGSRDHRFNDNSRITQYLSEWTCRECGATTSVTSFFDKNPSASTMVAKTRLKSKGSGRRAASDFDAY